VQPVVETVNVETAHVETTHPEVIATPVNEQPHLIAAVDEVVAEQVIDEVKPAQDDIAVATQQQDAPVIVAETAPAAAIEEVKPVEVVAQDAVVEETKVEEASVETTVVEEIAVAAVPEVKTIQPEVAVVAHVTKHATAPMTKAPAPEYSPEATRQSDWVRPTYEFSGRGSAGASSATHQATAPATRPQSAE
ncbi:MAG TPA: ribonuclease E, partial [Buttiauxella sp.]|nr:ribonuclease E [Buttiauxella sp.]